MSVGVVNKTVKAIRNARKLKEIARAYEQERKFAQRRTVMPLTGEQRIRNYANQSGWTADFTPAQRRRLAHKANRAQGRPNPYITKVDGAKGFETLSAVDESALVTSKGKS